MGTTSKVLFWELILYNKIVYATCSLSWKPWGTNKLGEPAPMLVPR
jgi:hypothetical protein